MQPQQVMKQQCTSVWGRQAKADWLVQQQQKMQNRTTRNNFGYENVKCVGRPASLSQSARPQSSSHVQHNGSGSRVAAVNGGSGVRRGCGGTGVFLPRQYVNPQESRKKTSKNTYFTLLGFSLGFFFLICSNMFCFVRLCCPCPASFKGCSCPELED